MHTIGVLIYIALGIIIPGIPAFIVGQRRAGQHRRVLLVRVHARAGDERGLSLSIA
jgi:hypothetical protein